jgi:cystathionine gamma-synthase
VLQHDKHAYLFRFFIHLSIKRLSNEIIRKYATSKEGAVLFPSPRSAQYCVSFILEYGRNIHPESVYVIELSATTSPSESSALSNIVSPSIWACIFPKELFSVAKKFWQHTGEGISSRRAEYCLSLLESGLLSSKSKGGLVKGPRRYQNRLSTETASSPTYTEKSVRSLESVDFNSYVEERFGRNLDISLSSNAKTAIRKRIAGSLTTDLDIKNSFEGNMDGIATEPSRGFTEDDVYLYPAGMNAIFNTHQTLLSAVGPRQSICFGYASFVFVKSQRLTSLAFHILIH